MPTVTQPDAVEDGGLRRLGERRSLHQYLQEIWDRRDFLLTLPLGRLRAQHQHTVLGNVWHLLNPLLLVFVYWLVFGAILQLGRGVDNYVGFLVIGIMVFNYTQRCLMAGSRALVGNIRLIQNLNVPRAVLPISAVIGETIAQGPAAAAMLAAMLATGEGIQISWVLLVLIVGLQALFNLGLAFYAGRLTFHFRDFEQILPFVLRLWLYLSGVFFATSFVPEGIPRTLFRLNPANAFIALTRDALMNGTTGAFEWQVAIGWTAALLFTGFFFFRQREYEYGRG